MQIAHRRQCLMDRALVRHRHARIGGENVREATRKSTEISVELRTASGCRQRADRPLRMVASWRAIA
jgi:hypothetical protein